MMKKCVSKVLAEWWISSVFLVLSVSYLSGQSDKGVEGYYPESSNHSSSIVRNDLCYEASPIQVGDVVKGSTKGATTIGQPKFQCGTPISTAGVWYLLEGTGNPITLSTCLEADFDTKIHVFTGSCEGFHCVGGQDNVIDCPDVRKKITFPSLCNTTYFVLVSGKGKQGGNFTLAITGDAGACNNSLLFGHLDLLLSGLIALILFIWIVRLSTVKQRIPQVA